MRATTTWASIARRREPLPPSACPRKAAGAADRHSVAGAQAQVIGTGIERTLRRQPSRPAQDRKSTRLNSSHVKTSYAVFFLKKKTSLYYHLSRVHNN